MIKAVIFDLDGTLLDTIPDIAASLNRALADCGLPTHSVRAFERFVGGGIRAAIQKAAPAGSTQETLEAVYRLYRGDDRERGGEETASYPGVRDMLVRLDQAGLLLGVLSNKSQDTARRIIAHYFPDVPFCCVFGREDGRPLKPDPGAARPVLETLALRPEEVVYVGDSGTDVQFARACGMTAAAVPWGYRSREELTGQGPDLLPDTMEDLTAGLIAMLS